MKQVEALEGVNTKVRQTVMTEFLTWEVSRQMRRDFYLFTAIMYRRKRAFKYHVILKNCLNDLTEKSNALAARFSPDMAMPPPVVHSVLPIEIRSPHAKRLYDAYLSFDKTLYKLKAVMHPDDLDAMCSGFWVAYNDLKCHLNYAPKAEQGPSTGK